MEDMSMKTEEPPKRPNCKGKLKKFSGTPSCHEKHINKERGSLILTRKGEDLLKGHLRLEKPSPSATAHLKIETACTRTSNIIDTLCL
jgi:hypothetical protein